MRALIITAAALALASCGGGTESNTAAPENTATATVDTSAAAKAEVAKFHELMDAGNGAEIYKGAAEALKSSVSEADFATSIAGTHEKLGNFKSSGEPVVSGDATQTVLTYPQSVFENGTVQEVFTYLIVDGKPQFGAYDYKAVEAAAAPAEDANAEEAPAEGESEQ
jgi:hypothetical protein